MVENRRATRLSVNATGQHVPVRHASVAPRRRSALRIAAAAFIFVFTFVTAGVSLGYTRLQGNIQQHDIDEYLGDDRPTPSPPAPDDPTPERPLNVLVLGSDSREGDNVDIDGSGVSEGMRSDTAMLVHISEDRSHVDVVSIPRDTLVDIPACRLPNGQESPPQSGAMFNSAFSTGGETGDVGSAAACTIKTVEKLSGVYIDAFVVVDFTGFINVVDALGGIAMYIPEDIDDPRADLQLAAGCRLLDGRQALGLARSRYSTDDGSDISRIDRQQEIVMEIIEEALTSNLLTDPIRLYRVLDVSTQTLTTSRGFGDIPRLAELARSLGGMDSDSVTMVTMPFDYAGPRVVPNAQYVQYVWDALIEDRPVDPAISGAGWMISQAGVPPWSADGPSSNAPPSGGSAGTAIGGTFRAPSALVPLTPVSVTPTPTDPAANCTKENAT